MKESDVEGVASRDGPESCGSVGNDIVEAFDRGMHEHGIELRDQLFRSADAVQRKRQATRRASLCEMPDGSAQSKTRRECRTFLRENREIPSPFVLATRIASRRPEATRR
jgi:hypothetical protein